MKYAVEFRPEAEKWLAEHINDVQLESLQGKRWKGLFKLRVGDYRILFTVNHNVKSLSVHVVGHRREIYE